jgi:CheY-like chemotaxis protein
MQTVVADAPKLDRGIASPGITVWQVEDNAVCRDLVAELLNQAEGICCGRSFESAEAMLSALKVAAPPSVILLDLNMKGMSGLEAIAPIKATVGDKTAIIIYTTFSDMYSKRTAFALGASAFLLKRVKVEQLIESIRQHASHGGASGLGRGAAESLTR